ncbi:hyaluronan-binding protein 2 isoform X2 [Austrofundulus limnaeus]|uniref:trypsin n=1 Tax=Austrofundulus limnaeus TaxID=52670 RepID=A0A2I4BSD3_AUSLI|nr:PREDICTED: hyaluronan-binding protein 2 isoform X2 [Austrofundulus limnaeus]
MKLKLLFFCFFLAAILIPAESKPKDKSKHEHQEHGKHGVRLTGKLRFEDIIRDVVFKDRSDDDDDDDDDNLINLDWLFDLQDLAGRCTPNPCLNNGVCKEKGHKSFKCVCPKPFQGRKCEKGPRICKGGLCGHGECVLTSTRPFYECKCKRPFQPPDCKRFSVCDPNPCKNGGRCIRDGNDFDCECPAGFRGRFCRVGPNDCYVDDGESYRGNVSETDDGHECLYWNSHFILENGINPFNSFEDKEGLGPHNFCRNPDGEPKPWCFFRKGRRLFWDYCDVTKCPKPTMPTQVVPTGPHPTSAKPPSTTTPSPKTTEPVTKPPDVTKVPQVVTTPPQVVTTPPQVVTTPPQVVTTPPDVTKVPQTITTATEAPTIASGTPAPLQFLTCGQPQPKKALTRIYGGLKVSPGAKPWQVSLQEKPKNSQLPYRHVCGGVLISSCWVLTAGHCINQNKDLQVVLGTLSLDKLDPGAQSIEVVQAIRHENYRETPEAVYNDIALLRLKGTKGFCASETQFVKTACLPDAQLPDGMDCTISGWGTTEESLYGSNHLLDANVLLISQEKCSEGKVYGSVLDITMFCAGHLQGGVDSCQGDSGGPLTCKQNNSHVVYGVVSWGDQCGRKNKPGVYARVTHFLDWIKSKTQGTL